MNSRRVLTLVLFLLSVTLVGCGSKGGGGSARIRVLNAIPDANAISVRLDNDAPIVSGLAFEQVTQQPEESLTIGLRQIHPQPDDQSGIGRGGAVLSEGLDMGHHLPHAVKLGPAAGAQPR